MTSITTGTKAPAAIPAAATPGAFAASTPSATLGAILAYTTHSATPSSSLPRLPRRSVPRLQKQLEASGRQCDEGPICSGAGDLPTGSLWPKKADVAVQDCHETMPIYTNSNNCVAATSRRPINIRFEENVDLVAIHMKPLECYTFDSVYGLTSFMSMFVTDKILMHEPCRLDSRVLSV
ncbi:uncharacterized protein PITG_02970 [Phytophthora infestans T30-4]|uniref:Uncharacterized protein n=1 Tax=Phytophthora infestans (strain T30-4) TaxID=403677 RepID=D0MXL9_PHYIT|nr:uncharacterized protein PITG_02970 [Phytophthora infestans T30-4]EEY64382.1 hypothetical protein PITG_02970 [Phytophthora infestans T30-4]|eukprot:XP_002907818.1 hypothetical protein PITG_02970 [Phytophthora infestans T30-4]